MVDEARADDAAVRAGAWQSALRAMRSIAPRLHPFRPRLLDDLAGYDARRFGADLGAGISVGIVALPLAMAFAIASGVKPEQGLFTAIIAGFLISALGGSSVQIGGPAGAFIVIVYGIVQRYGVANLLIATVLAGVLLLAARLAQARRARALHPGLDRHRLHQRHRRADRASRRSRTCSASRSTRCRPTSSPRRTRSRAIAATFNPAALGLGALCFLGLPSGRPAAFPTRSLARACCRTRRAVVRSRAPARRAATRIPGPIVALVTLSIAAALLALPVETIGTRFGGIPRELPAFVWPDFDWASVQRLFVPTVTIALLGAVESLLCARVADGMATTRRRHDPNQELMAQGVANIVTPFFGGIPATGTIARTVTNVRAGATSPVAGIVHAVVLLVIVLVAAPLAVHVPLAVLAGVLLFVAWNMGEWNAFRRMSAFSVEQRIKLFQHLPAHRPGRPHGGDGGRPRRRLPGLRLPDGRAVPGRARPRPRRVGARRRRLPAVRAAVLRRGRKLEALPDQLPPGTTTLALDAHQLVSIDASGLDAFENVHRALTRAGIRLVVVGLNEQPLAAMRKWGLDAVIGAENLFADRDSAFAALVEAKAQQ